MGGRGKDRHELNCTISLVTGNPKGSFSFFSRVAAAIVFDLSRIQTFHSVSKVGTERRVLLIFN